MVEADSTVLAESVLETSSCSATSAARSRGAVARKAGLIELAANGTLFIDEIGVLESEAAGEAGCARSSTGASSASAERRRSTSSVRLVTSSNHDLEQRVRDGRFRDDLLYRLNVVTVALPPLRERSVDIPLLAQHFLTQLAGAVGADAHAGRDRAMQEYPWPGNVRELRNVIERVVLLAARRRSRNPRAGPAAGRAASRSRCRRLGDDARGARAAAHRGGAAADELAPGQRRQDPRHLVQDAVPKDSRVRVSAAARG